MKLLSKCEGCKQRKLLLKKRVFKTKHGGAITSQKQICGQCKKNTVVMLGEEIV